MCVCVLSVFVYGVGVWMCMQRVYEYLCVCTDAAVCEVGYIPALSLPVVWQR